MLLCNEDTVMISNKKLKSACLTYKHLNNVTSGTADFLIITVFIEIFFLLQITFSKLTKETALTLLTNLLI